MAEQRSPEVGTITRVMKQVSEADVALFDLVTTDDQLTADDPPRPVRPQRRAAPFPLVAALLAAAAARHVARPTAARFERQDVCFTAPAYTGDTLCAVAELAGYDVASQTLHVRGRCENQHGQALATGDFYLCAE